MSSGNRYGLLFFMWFVHGDRRDHEVVCPLLPSVVAQAHAAARLRPARGPHTEPGRWRRAAGRNNPRRESQDHPTAAAVKAMNRYRNRLGRAPGPEPAIRPWLIEMSPATVTTGPMIANGIARIRTSLACSPQSWGCCHFQSGSFRSPADEASALRAKLSANPRKLVTIARPNTDAVRPHASMNRPGDWLACVAEATWGITGPIRSISRRTEVSRVHLGIASSQRAASPRTGHERVGSENVAGWRA